MTVVGSIVSESLLKLYYQFKSLQSKPRSRAEIVRDQSTGPYSIKWKESQSKEYVFYSYIKKERKLNMIPGFSVN